MDIWCLSNLIVGGDWNWLTLQPIAKKGGIPWRPTVYRDQLIGLIDVLGS